MRIVKSNLSKEELPEKELTCIFCKSVVAYTERDIHKRVTTMRTGTESSTDYINKYIICPVCNNTILLEHYTEEF